MTNTNSTRVDQPQPVVRVEGEVAPESPSLAASAEAKVKVGSGSFPATEAANLEHPVPAASSQKFSRRVWRHDNRAKPINNDGDHWKYLYGKADQFDKEFCGGWNSEIDALLTFAGLFSAVVTAFTIESYKLLQPDPQETTNQILLNISVQLAGRNVTALPPESFTPSASSLRINTLWFMSLTFSLTAGLVGILCKQWLRHYQQDISKPPKEALAIRQFRYESLLRCRVMDILSALPILLGLGLILFFVGLIDFLRGLNVKVSIPITILIGAGFAFLTVTTSAPALQLYATNLQHSRYRKWDVVRPVMFAFKSPQSLAILHLVTCLFPLSKWIDTAPLKVPSWTSLEVIFFNNQFALWTYTGRALTWLDDTYSRSLDMAYHVSFCLQDIAEGGVKLDVGFFDRQPEPTPSVNEVSLGPGAAAIKSFFNHSDFLIVSEASQSIIAARYLLESTPRVMSFDQNFTVMKRLIHTLNSPDQIPSSPAEPLEQLFDRLSSQAHGHLALEEQMQEMIWQKAILFQGLLSKEQWEDSASIPTEVGHVSKNLGIFTDEDLNSIFNELHTWIDQHPRDVAVSSHCWAAMTSRLKFHEPDEALRRRPPVRDFMTFLGSRFQMGEGVKYFCSFWDNLNDEAAFDSFFTALSAWIGQNPQSMRSFIHCRELLTGLTDWHLVMARQYQSFRDFEALLETIARNKDVVREGPVQDLRYVCYPG